MSNEYAARTGASVRDKSKGDSYDDIEPWLTKLADLPSDSIEHDRLRSEIIARCLPLGEHIARRYSGRGVDFDDLAQIAAVGVILAVDRFDPGNGAPFLSFAVPTIMGEVRRYFRDSTWAVRVPRRIKEIQQRLTTVVPELSQRLGHSPTAQQLADELGIEPGEVTQALIASNCYTTDSLDSDSGGGDDGGDRPVSQLEKLAVEENGFTLVEETLTAAPLLAALPERERRILIMRYGHGKTQAEIAREIGVSQMQVSRLLSRTLAGLREQALPALTHVA
ncbi:SigB/SigF/SigG family RNA polymerase sigma factor [Nocardia sp. alder85J]|uniref:SigB/SigF/SigG family RNA polymerase sigma factor n=1 Tax=Nocardia sp. alder85J TaxID=2862949 RepID=UPI001CD4AD33|nr:SigB/SigF/SigG family RNA polymerase sigma factor [Nocardia sp. alder85J]MCX4095250.1 SigB/SigF/SigG family RNA polymerase sigma factor [Nocardia sp. alder85J]